MEKLGQVLASLTIDQAFFYQLGILIAIFFLLHFVFFERLREIVILREDKTTGSIKAAEEKLTKAQELSDHYQERLGEAKIEAQKIFNDHKQVAIEDGENHLKEAEGKISVHLQGLQEKLRGEVVELRKKTLGVGDTLAEELVKKMLR